MQNDRIIEKIKKLFALAKCDGAMGAEAENAMRMAQKLLEKHALTIFDIEKSSSGKVTIAFCSYKNVPWTRVIAINIAHLYNCECIISFRFEEPKQIIIGTESNTTTAKIVSDQIVEAILKEGKGKCIEFKNGAALAVQKTCQKLIAENNKSKEEILPGTGLVPIDLSKRLKQMNEEWISENLNTFKLKNVRLKASESGIEFGNSLNVGPRVGGATQKMLTN